ncbi:MAG TPA: hypothetical protein VGZ05_08335 [Steroidobacteraceae bacterium]|nr:hypothetical protein [Steroidobacteraceae bacterium]
MTTALPYLRRRRARLALLVLPALLRALIPMGFMPLADATGVSIGFCPGAGVIPGLPADAVHAQHFGHAHAPHAGGWPGGGGALHHAPCLFASGAASAFAAALPVPALAAAALPSTDDRAAPGVFLPAIRRAQFARAPPLIA